jgi:hypothetical protein
MNKVIWALWCLTIASQIFPVHGTETEDSDYLTEISSSPFTEDENLQIPAELEQICSQYKVVPLPQSAGHLCSKPSAEAEHGHCSLLLTSEEIIDLTDDYSGQILNGVDGFCDDESNNCNCGLAPDGKTRRACVYYAAPEYQENHYYMLNDFTYNYPRPVKKGDFRKDMETYKWLDGSQEWLLPGDIVALKASQVGFPETYYKRDDPTMRGDCKPVDGVPITSGDSRCMAPTSDDKTPRNYIGTLWNLNIPDFAPLEGTGKPHPDAIFQYNGFNGTAENPIYFTAEDSLRYDGCYHFADDVVPPYP